MKLKCQKFARRWRRLISNDLFAFSALAAAGAGATLTIERYLTNRRVNINIQMAAGGLSASYM